METGLQGLAVFFILYASLQKPTELRRREIRLSNSQPFITQAPDYIAKLMSTLGQPNKGGSDAI